MRAITLAIVATLVAAGCQKEDAETKGFEGWPPWEIKNVEEAYPELPPVEVPRLEGLADSRPINYDLSEVSNLPSNWGTPAQRRLLSDHGFVVTDETYRQMCSFYIHHSGRPTIITTDSALYAYFINLEEGLYRLEVAQADRLPELLKKLRGRLAEERTKYKSGVSGRVSEKVARDLDDYLLVAETLTYANTKGAIPKGTPAEVASEIKLILAAKGPAVSPLRGVPLDYSRFEPRGLYAKKYLSPEELSHGVRDGRKQRGKLRTYYRAVTWLRDVPFRVSDENETLQALLLAALDVALGSKKSPLAAFNAPYLEFLGPSDDPGIQEYRKVYLEQAGSLDRLESDEERRKKAFAALRELPPPRHTTIPEKAAVEDPARYGGLRFIPRPALYENEIFNPLCPFGMERLPASGEEFFAVVGSRAAQEIVKNREARRVPGYDKLFAAAVAASEKAKKTYDTEICRKRRALYRTLLTMPQDSKLPPYYRHSAWRYKDLNTCLAGWAQQRYIWDLHGKRIGHYLKDRLRFPPGPVVEPNVAFFRTLAELSRESSRFFGRYGVKDHRFDDFAEFAATLAVIASRQLEQKPLDSGQSELLEQYGEELANFCGFYRNSWCNDERLPDTPFCVPVAVDLFYRDERVVGQGRPRAIYVICEQEGQKFLARGGVLSYRDWVGPAWGEGKMTEKRWLELAAAGKLKAAAWQEKFSLPGEFTGKSRATRRR